MNPPYVLVKYNSTHRRYTKGGLCYYLAITFSCLECSNFASILSLYFFLFIDHNGSPLTDCTLLQTKYGLSYGCVHGRHKIRQMCNPRSITLHEKHMSHSLFRNLLTLFLDDSKIRLSLPKPFRGRIHKIKFCSKPTSK